MYQIGDTVVYKRDVCQVIGKHKSDFTGEMCYILIPIGNSDGTTRMQVPISNKAGHLRELITEEQIHELIKQVPEISALDSKPANMKNQYLNLMNSFKIEDLICIIKTSYMRNQMRLEANKPLASVDEEYLQRAEKYLFTEISASMHISYDQAKTFFHQEVAKVIQD